MIRSRIFIRFQSIIRIIRIFYKIDLIILRDHIEERLISDEFRLIISFRKIFIE